MCFIDVKQNEPGFYNADAESSFFYSSARIFSLKM